jgi:hypothetical protein
MRPTILTITFMTFLGLVPVSKASDHIGCFERHIWQSISVNKEVKTKYAQATQNKSDKILNQLIAAEKISLIVARKFDQDARAYQEKGIDLLCQEFKDLNNPADISTQQSIDPIKPFSWKKQSRSLALAIKSKDISKIQNAATEAMKEIEDQPNYYCFSRHMFESIYRIAYFMNYREEQSKKASLKSPKKMLLKILKLHQISLGFANHIDQLSAPIQENGTNILCQELPNLLADLK